MHHEGRLMLFSMISCFLEMFYLSILSASNRGWQTDNRDFFGSNSFSTSLPNKMPDLCQIRSQEPNLGLPSGWQGPKYWISEVLPPRMHISMNKVEFKRKCSAKAIHVFHMELHKCLLLLEVCDVKAICVKATSSLKNTPCFPKIFQYEWSNF